MEGFDQLARARRHTRGKVILRVELFQKGIATAKAHQGSSSFNLLGSVARARLQKVPTPPGHKPFWSTGMHAARSAQARVRCNKCFRPFVASKRIGRPP